MKTGSPPPPNGVRPGFLGLLFLAVAAVIAVVIFFNEDKKSFQSNSAGEARPAKVTALAPAQIQPGLERKTLPVFPVAPEATDPATVRLVARLFDKSLPLNARCQAARDLARIGSDTAMTALKTALATNSPPYLQAAVAEGLGECSNPQARALLEDLAYAPDEITARGAVRGLALRGDADAVNVLDGLLFNEYISTSVRSEAAIALGDVNLPGAVDTLTRAAREIENEDIAADGLGGLGKQPFAGTEKFFTSYLASEDTPAESKAAALEALGGASGDVAPFLLKYLRDPDADLRAAAAWALSTTAGDTGTGALLVAALKQETDPRVSARIYQALASQPGADVPSVLTLVQKEADPAAQLAGLAYLAGTLRAAAGPDVVNYFNQTAIPQLQNIALNSASPQNRLAAVIVLARAGTPAAAEALHEIARQSADSKVIAAAQTSPARQSHP